LTGRKGEFDKISVNSTRRPALVFWTPITILEPPISGDKVNEIELIRVLSSNFVLHAFVPVSFSKFGKRRALTNRVFKKNTQFRVTTLPCPNVGREHKPSFVCVVLSGLACSAIVALNVLIRKLTVGVDLVISRGGVQSVPVMLACRLSHVKYLYNTLSVPFSYRETDFTWKAGFWRQCYSFMMKLIDYFLLRNANHVGAANQAAVRDLVTVFGRKYQRKIVPIRIPIPDTFFNYPPRISTGGDIELVYHGSLGPMYDFSQLMKAIEAMNRIGRKVSLTIFSSLSSRHMLGEYGSGHWPFLTFKDQMPRDELIGRIRQATAVVVPLAARVPGVSVKALEAMALGVPVIISNSRDTTIFRDDETCITVDPNTVERWESAITRANSVQHRKKIIPSARAQAEAFRSTRILSAVTGLLSQK
jgi:glycosyltransferase involved in cell wall biosynthesis